MEHHEASNPATPRRPRTRQQAKASTSEKTSEKTSENTSQKTSEKTVKSGRSRQNIKDPVTSSTEKGSPSGKEAPPSQPPLPRPEEVPLDPKAPTGRLSVETVEVRTRGQRENPEWFHWRQNRITASVAHRVAHSRFCNGKSETPPASYLKAITGTGSNLKTRAMQWGIDMEDEAVKKYETMKSKLLGRPVVAEKCGLFIDAQRPWLAGSPDRIVVDKKTGQRLLCLEVKCPYKHRDATVEEACQEDPAFCLEMKGEGPSKKASSYILKEGHSYYTQIQCQLAVTGLEKADLVVYTRKETAIVPVTFDPEFWEETVAKLEHFYKFGLLPYVREM